VGEPALRRGRADQGIYDLSEVKAKRRGAHRGAASLGAGDSPRSGMRGGACAIDRNRQMLAILDRVEQTLDLATDGVCSVLGGAWVGEEAVATACGAFFVPRVTSGPPCSWVPTRSRS
jgi:hypothetical protein